MRVGVGSVQADEPERLLRRSLLRSAHLSTGGITDEDLRQETDFIYTHAFISHGHYSNVEALKESITNVLRYMTVDRLDIPYIATYLADNWQANEAGAAGLHRADLWIIDQWDDLWVHLQRRRARLETTIRELAPMDYDLSGRLFQCASEVELDDMAEYLIQLQHQAEASSGSTKSKPSRFVSVLDDHLSDPSADAALPTSKSASRKYVAPDVRVVELASSFGLASRTVSKNMTAYGTPTFPVDPYSSPAHQAAAVLAGACECVFVCVYVV
jgi:hypothetical protein